MEMPGPVRKALEDVQSSLKQLKIRARWVRAENIHLTLKFLGETRSSQIDAVQKAAAASCIGTGELSLALGRVGAFPSSSRPRVVWVGLEGDIPGLVSLAGRLDRGLQALGFRPEERPFSPHLTIARVRPDASLQEQAEIGAALSRARPPASLRFTASEVSLIRSQLRPEGPLYTCLARWPLST